jgi:ketosteroid isomerase-like protein
MNETRSAADALKHSFDTGDRSLFEAMFAPDCVNWHNSDKLVVPAIGFDGVGALRQLVDNLHADIIQHETFASGHMIRIAIRGTVRSSGGPLDAHNCIVLTVDGDGRITRIDDYVDPTFVAQILPESA